MEKRQFRVGGALGSGEEAGVQIPPSRMVLQAKHRAWGSWWYCEEVLHLIVKVQKSTKKWSFRQWLSKLIRNNIDKKKNFEDRCEAWESCSIVLPSQVPSSMSHFSPH